ncbi:unnamed protein product [Ectocarpus sp. 12 AP-2014]
MFCHLIHSERCCRFTFPVCGPLPPRFRLPIFRIHAETLSF